MGRGGAPIENTLVPTRFMLLMAQTIVTIMTFYTKEQNVYASMGSVYSQTEYDDYDEQMKILLGLSIVCLAVMLGGLVTGVTMFAHRVNVLHIGLHFAGTCCMAWATLENWTVESMWAVAGCLCFFPAVLEALSIVSVCCFKTHRY